MTQHTLAELERALSSTGKQDLLALVRRYLK